VYTTVKLASIRCPRPATRDGEADEWAHEAKELLRSNLVGQQVTVKADYMRLVGEVDTPHVTITHKGKNWSVELAKQGLCETMRHRGDEDRAVAYDTIAEAEASAKERKLRMHGKPGAAPSHRYNEHSVNAQKAKTFLPILQRQGRVPAIVDFVMNGGKVKLTLPGNSAVIAFGLSGVRLPQSTRGDEPGQPFGDEAQDFTRVHCLQRDVEIEVEACDRGGSFLGTLWVNGESLAVNLLRNGYAWCSDSVDRSPYASQLMAAEQAAKSAKMRTWEQYDEEAIQRAEEERRAAEIKATTAQVSVEAQHIVNGNTFFVHMKGPDAENLIKLREKNFASCDFGAASSGNRYRANQYCSAEWSTEQGGDGDMYRSKVLRHDDGWYEVQFIDYGNTTWVKGSDMQQWEAGDVRPPLAYECKLAYVKVPVETEDYFNDAGQWLADRILRKGLKAQIVAKAGETYHLMLFDGDQTVNAEHLRSGFSMLTKDAKRNGNPSKELQEMTVSVEHAKSMRSNLWRHGDPESDDEDAPRAWGR